MHRLLERLDIDSELLLDKGRGEVPALVLVDGCVFLAQEYERTKGANLQQFLDRTGYECFVNHVHFSVGRAKRALSGVFEYAAGLRSALFSLGEGRFEIIISVSRGTSTVRFHKCRPGESWLGDDLEKYKYESILTTSV